MCAERQRRTPSRGHRALADALRAVPGLRVLDVQSDASHNRSVFTLAGDAAHWRPACRRSSRARSPAIDLRKHSGEHPRMGAVDVVPVHSDRRRDDGRVRGAGEGGCRRRGRALRAAGVSVRRSGGQPARQNLEDIRRGEFEGLAAKMAQPGMGARLRAGGAAPIRRRDGHRRTDAAHRLQHQSRDQSARRREEDRGGDSHEQRRPALREGHGHLRSRTAASSRFRST